MILYRHHHQQLIYEIYFFPLIIFFSTSLNFNTESESEFFNALKIVTKPFANTYQYNGNFFWKIGKSSDFKQKVLNRIIFNDYPI